MANSETKVKEFKVEIVGNRRTYANRYVPIKFFNMGIKNIPCRFVFNNAEEKIVAEYECFESDNYFSFGYINPEVSEGKDFKSESYVKGLLNLCSSEGKMPKIEAEAIGVNDNRFMIGIVVNVKLHYESELEALIEDFDKNFGNKDSLETCFNESSVVDLTFERFNRYNKDFRNFVESLNVSTKIMDLKDVSIDFNETLKSLSSKDLENSNIVDALLERASMYESVKTLSLEDMRKNPLEGLETLRKMSFNETELIKGV